MTTSLSNDFNTRSSKLVKNVFKKLFNIRDKVEVHQPNSFKEDSSFQEKITANSKKAADKAIPPSISADVVDITALFYSLLFSAPAVDNDGVANNLEKKVIADVEHALADPMEIAHSVLKLPSRMVELDRRLADDSVDIKDLLTLIQQDPVLSVEVLSLCNSPAFKRSSKEITSLQMASVQLGRSQLRRLVSTSMVREIIAVKPIYYRRFGAQIWRHSMQVAFLAGEMSESDPDTAFMLGLLHDVGKIAIFKLLLDAFNQAEPGEQPNSRLFRQIMTAKSLSLSALLAKCWQLPETFSESLILLANISSRPTDKLAAVVWRANLISECSMLYQRNKLDQASLNRLLLDVELSFEEFELLHEKLQQF